MPTRLTVSGSSVKWVGVPFVPVGINVSVRTYIPGDMAIVKAMGANMVRVHVLWYNTVPQTPGDAYSPGSPGNFDPGKLATMRAMVAEAQSVGLWCDIAVSGCGADFWTNATVQAQHVVMWQFLAATFANEEWIMAYELLCEPHPVPVNPTLISAIYTATINAVTPIDPATPMIIGPGLTYDIRYLSQALLGLPNLIYTFDWYEPSAYVYQADPATWTGYPGYPYLDVRGQRGDCPVAYPGKGTVVTLDKVWLDGLLAVGTAFRDANSVPVWCNQIGITSLIPGSSCWVRNSLDNLNRASVGWCVWTLRSPWNSSSIGNPFGATNSAGDIGLYWQDGVSKVWTPKLDLIALVSAELAAAGGSPSLPGKR